MPKKKSQSTKIKELKKRKQKKENKTYNFKHIIRKNNERKKENQVSYVRKAAIKKNLCCDQ